MDSSSGTDLLGRVIAGKFKLRRFVGLGASGAVYEADQVTLGRTVAVKVLRPDLASDPKVADRFQHEAQLASKLNHPNCVTIIDYGSTSDGLLYMAMEFVRGETITSVLRASGPPILARTVDYISQVLDGLEEAHAAGVVHADVKADNVMVEHRRGFERVKVLDFGIAQLAGVGLKGSGETSTGTICGTPEYMAPEVIRGKPPSFSSDLYAVGILFYELLTGATPFAGGASMDVLTRHLRESHKPLSEMREALPSYVESALAKALAKEPTARFSSASEFRDFLRTAAGRLAESAGRVLCAGCGVKIASGSRFCPECGCPQQQPVAAGDDSVESSAQVSTESVLHGPLAQARVEFAAKPRVAGDASAPTPAGALPLPMVGRDREAAALLEFLTGKTERSLLLVTGDLGAGRRELIVRQAERAADFGALVCMAGADPSGLRASLYPIRSALCATLGVGDPRSEEELHDRALKAGLSEGDLPGLRELFGHTTALSSLEKPARRRELHAATLRALGTVAAQQRAVLVFTGFDAYDEPSRQILHRLAGLSRAASEVRMVVACGQEIAATWPGGAEQLQLGPLDERALDKLAGHLLANGTDAMPSKSQLSGQCHGNPEHIVQLVRYVAEGGDVSTAPASLPDLIASRVSTLPRAARRLAQAAAVLGLELSSSLLDAITIREVTPDERDEALAVLIARGILEEETAGFLRFPQPLVRDVIYDAAPADVRRELHDLVVVALQGTGASFLLLGHHADMAGDAPQAAWMLETAGDTAVAQLDDAGACDLYRRALAAARAVLMGAPSDNNERRFVTVSIKLADALRSDGNLALARGVLSDARGYTEQVPSLSSAIDRAEGGLLLLEGHLEQAAECLRRGLSTAIKTGQTTLMCELVRDLATVKMRSGRPAEAARELREGIDLLTFGEGPEGTGGPPELWTLVLRLAKIEASRGSAHDALDLGKAALARVQELGYPVGEARVGAFLAQAYADIGDIELAQEYRKKAISELRALGDRRATAELLYSAASPTSSIGRSGPELLREAERLAAELGEADDLSSQS